MTANMETFSLQDVERITGIRETTLRFYLKKFRKFFEPIHRGPFNSIIFTEKDINLFLKIRTLGKQHSLGMEDIENALITENAPAISIVKDEDAEIAIRESTDLAMRKDDLKKVLCDNSIVLNEIMVSQQMMQEKQQKLIKILQGLEALPGSIQMIVEKLDSSENIITENSRTSRDLEKRLENLEKENRLLREKLSVGERGLLDRFWEAFKTWFFEERPAD